MARLNIEDQFWIDVMSLVAKFGDQDKAIGQAVRFLRFAQEMHRKGRSVTIEEFRRNGFDEALLGVFAEAKPSGIEAKGSEKHFSWLNQKVEAGKRGGASKSPAKLANLKQGKYPPKKPQLAILPEAKPSDPEASLSSSLSLSSNNLIPSELRQVAQPPAPDPRGIFLGKYREAFKARYGIQPNIDNVVAKRVGDFLRGRPIDQAVQLIQAYCQMDGHRDFFKTRGHDFATFQANINPILIAIKNGFDPGKPKPIDWAEVERISKQYSGVGA